MEDVRVNRGAKTRLVGVILIFVGLLDSMLAWRGGFAVSGFYVVLIASGILLYVVGAIRRGERIEGRSHKNVAAMSDVDVLVIGGGISGLATASSLAREGLSVEVWEREARPGGKIRTRECAGYLLEQSASMVMNFRPEVNRFLAESGMQRHKVNRASLAHRYLIDQGCLVTLPVKLGAMATSPLWSAGTKLRMFTELFVKAGGHEQETVSEFIERRLGREVLDKAMDPYIAGPLASDPDRANAWATLPRLTALEQRYGSLTMGVFVHKVLRRRTAVETEVFSFQGGMRALTEGLANSVGVQFRCGWTATELLKGAEDWTVCATVSGVEQSLRARQVVLSVPADVAASLVAPLDRELAGLLDEIEYTPLAVVHTGYPRTAISHPLDGSGFLVPRSAGLPITGCMWTSSLFPDHAPGARALLSSYIGGARHPAAALWSDDRSVVAVTDTLASLLGVKGDPELVHIDRHPQGLPLYHGAYPARITAIENCLQPLRGLHLEANYKGGVSVRDRIVCAHRGASRIRDTLQQASRAATISLGRQGLSPLSTW